MHEERVAAVREEPNLHLSSASERLPLEHGHPGFRVLVVSNSFQEMVKIAQKIENTVLPFIREEPNVRLKFYLRDVTDAVTLVLPC